ncbi:hypothetical protein K474DRAFT_1667031 [Panus rudis PR-1116 ss-1]|nr:hypothetical protein K474DRAFT_1667031 [Panus rudis PR-1116 ss-1]
MPSTSTFLLFLAIFLSALAVTATPTATTIVERDITLNPVGITLNPVEHSVEARAVPLTNAQRLARGLTPNKPRFNHAKKNIHARQSPVPCPTVSGVIAASIEGQGPGYVAAAPNIYGEYGFTTNVNAALRVSVKTCEGEPAQITSSNGATAFPDVGLVTGFANSNADLSTGSYNYVYFAGVTQTAPGSPPQTAPSSYSAATGLPASVESAIWNYDSSSQALTPFWVNTDGSLPAVSTLYAAGDNVFIVTGDVDDFRANFGTLPAATFRVVPATVVY